MEIERKWLVACWPEGAVPSHTYRMDQGYIALSPTVRIRREAEGGVVRHVLCFKGKADAAGLAREEIETEIAPIVGNEQQAKDLIAYIKDGEATEDGVWDTNIFGKSVEQIVEDGMQAKISQMTEDCQMKLQDTLQKIINDSNGGMICIII